jgi:thioredoxin-like negative regulator of GroEL
MAGMLKVYVAAGELETARQALASLTEEMKADPAIQAAQTALDLAEKAAALVMLRNWRPVWRSIPDDHRGAV